MSDTIPFDTLHNYERLIKVGFNEAQAKEHTAIIAELVDHRLATKQDIDTVRKEIKDSKKEIIIWLGGIIIVSLGLAIEIVSLIIKVH